LIYAVTIIVPPINRIPRSPRDFFTYLWKTIRYKVMDLGGYLAFRLQSKGSLMKKPLFKLDRKGILPTAKALHRAFSEAVAAGDKTALRRVTTDNVYNQYADVIFRRPQSKRYRWELVRYNAQWRLPRIASHRIMPLPKSPQLPPAAIHQVVVTIACRQRLVELEETPKALARRRTRDGAVDDLPDIVEKSQKEADLTEHIVLTRLFNTKTYVTTDWKLAGTLGETSLEKIKEDEALIADMEQKEFTKSRA
jgi:protein MBA1